MWIVTWSVIGNSGVTRAELFETLEEADAFYGLLANDRTATEIKLIKGEIIH